MSNDILKTSPVIFTVKGEPASKANQRRAVTIGGKPRFIKSKKALDYGKLFQMQCPKLDPMMEGDLGADILIWYASRRPDLCEDLILDLMQDRIYKNDRQVKYRRVVWMGVDKVEPRAMIRVYQIDQEAVSQGILDQISNKCT